METSSRYIAWAAAVAWLTVALTAWVARADDAGGRPARVPWTTGRVTGSPEPPPSHVAERAFPKLTFARPVDITFEPRSGRVFVVEQQGTIRSFPNNDAAATTDLAIDLRSDLKSWQQVPDCNGVQSAFGLTFHPRFAENRYCYVSYLLSHRVQGKDLPTGQRVSRFTVTATDPPRLDPASEQLVLEWQGGGHMGACLKFGPADGCLYVSAGDAGVPSPPDPYHTGQDISDLLASVLRIDVDHPDAGRPYKVPADNPFVSTPGARPEVWAFGLRNVWKMSFDRATGELWAGDVGWELWEMVDRIERGGNYGWSIMEGPHVVQPDGKLGPAPIRKPDLALAHSESASVTGGYVYRGKRLPELAGQYVFGDWDSRRVWAAPCDGKHLAPHRLIAQTDARVIGFAEDADGELVFGDYEGGGLYRLAPNPDAGRAGAFPRKLSETGLFESVREQKPAEGVVPFSINAEQWNDGATAERFIAVPGTEPVRLDKDGHNKVFPKDSVLVRTFSLNPSAGRDVAARRRVETQLLHFDGKRWNGYTYRWDERQADADLVDAAGAESTWSLPDAHAADGGKLARTWRYPSRAQCMTCHTNWTDYTLALTVPQLDRPPAPGGRVDNGASPLASLRAAGLFPPAPPSGPTPHALTNPRDASADVASRARAYLDVNCAHCHRPDGGGAALIDLRDGIPVEKMRAIGWRPVAGDLGLPDGRILAPGDPARSVLLYRMAKLGPGRMPHVGSYVVDADGVALIAEWVRHMSPVAGVPPADPAAAKRSADEQFQLHAAQLERSQSSALARLDPLLLSPSGALAVALALDQFAPAIRQGVVAKAIESPQETTRDLFERFVPPDKLVKRLGPNVNAAEILALHGDAARGRSVFFGAAGGAGGLCNQCHQVGGQGEDFGPDLSHVAKKYDRAALLDNVLNPSKVIEPAYVNYTLRTTDGDDHVGLIVERTPREVVLKDLQRQLVRVPAEKVQKLTPQPLSPMPEGLLGGLTAQQAADLIDYLAAQK